MAPASGDFLPSGVVITPYLAYPLAIGEECAATRADYQAFVTVDCAGLSFQVSLVEGALGPAGAGTCVCRPSPDERAAAAAMVGDALISVITETTSGWSPSPQLGVAAQALADWVAQHPFDDIMTSTDPAAQAFICLLAQFTGGGSSCGSVDVNGPADVAPRPDLVDTIEDAIRSGIAEYVTPQNLPATASATAIGSGRLWVTWCAANLG